MSIKKFLKTKPQLYSVLFFLLKSINYFNKQFHNSYKNYTPTSRWKLRTELVISSPDNDKIHKSDNAGKIYNRYQMMHNGLKINLGSYYNVENAYLLEKNQGVHEPQEEYVFQEVLKQMPQRAAMMELGSYWAFYSMWFASHVKSYRCYMIEPDPHKILLGKWNFKLNGMKGVFKNAFIGSKESNRSNIPTVTIDSLVSEKSIDFIDILHSDIQGFEFEMLEGATDSLRSGKIGFIFVSTHSNELHEKCIKKLKDENFDIICEADLDASYSWDGLIVAKSANYKPEIKVKIHKRKLIQLDN